MKVANEDLEKYSMNYIEGQQLINCKQEHIKTEEQLLRQIWYMTCMVTSSYDEFQKETVNKTMLTEEYADYCLKILNKTDLSVDSDNFVYNLYNTAREVFKCNNREVVIKCLPYAWDLSEQGTYIINDITDAINTLEIIEDKLVYPERWFSKNLYKSISELLKTFDFERTKYKGRVAYKKQGEFTAEQVIEVAKELKGISLSTEFNFYPTPKVLVDKVQKLAQIKENDQILEPSAGTGSLVDGITNKSRITCIELNKVLCSILKSKGYKVHNYAFEDNTLSGFNKILMNPPFQNRTDAKHIIKAFSHLHMNGILVAIHSSAIITALDKYSIAYRELFNKYGTHREKIDSGVFKDSGKGTMIETYISVFNKRELSPLELF